MWRYGTPLLPYVRLQWNDRYIYIYIRFGTWTEQRKCHFNGEATDFFAMWSKSCHICVFVCFRLVYAFEFYDFRKNVDKNLKYYTLLTHEKAKLISSLSLSCFCCHIPVYLFIYFYFCFSNLKAYFFCTGNSNGLSFNENWINYHLHEAFISFTLESNWKLTILLIFAVVTSSYRSVHLFIKFV